MYEFDREVQFVIFSYKTRIDERFIGFSVTVKNENEHHLEK